MAETVKKNISLPTEVAERLSHETNASGLITALLRSWFARADRCKQDAATHEYESREDGKVYRFKAVCVGNDWNNDDEYFLKDDGTMIVVNGDYHPTVVPAAEIEDWFRGREESNKPVDGSITEEFGIKPAVWL